MPARKHTGVEANHLNQSTNSAGQGFGGVKRSQNAADEGCDRTVSDRGNQSIPTGFQSSQDAGAEQVSASVGIVANRGMQQLKALQDQQSAYVEQFSDAASDLIVSTEAAAWIATAEKVAAKLGAYSPVDTVNVFTAFTLDLTGINSRLQGIAEPAALLHGKANAGV